MKKRIKYQNFISGIILSEDILCNDLLLHIGIDTHEDYFNMVIVNINNYILYERKTKTIAQAKRFGKAKLKEMGALFLDEVRGKIVI